MVSVKPKIIQQIEKLLGKSLGIHPVDHLGAVMGFQENHPKYCFKDGKLIGLNLADTDVDDSSWLGIVKVLGNHTKYLQALNLSDNRLTVCELPVEMQALRSLDVSDNKLREFSMPSGVENLTDLNLFDNPLKSPPADVVEQGKNAILKWLRDTDKLPILEAKVMFIGDSNYGKTHLIEMLRHREIKRENITTTHGIERNRLQDAMSNMGNIRLNAWDLGGQQFMRSTHQFFFTERTLYVLVTVARRERKDLNHWLELVRKIGGDSPVLVVINKVDLDTHDIDREPLQRDYPNIKGFVRTAIYDNPRTGVVALETIDNLEKEINRIVSDPKLMPGVFTEQRPDWFAVKKELESITKNYICYEEYLELEGVSKLPDEEQQLNLKQLASLGTVVSFVEDPRLFDTHVINPKWITDGVYRLINDQQIKDERRGEFSFDDFSRLLDTEDYPRARYPFLVYLMEKFKLCYPVKFREGTFLFPDLFINIEPDNIWPQKNDFMRFRLNYGNYPPDLFITQFIVERYHSIDNEKRWRSGVVVIDGDCRAIVRRSFRDDHIEIEIDGPIKMRRGYLHGLLDIFSQLHRPYKEIKVLREIPYKDYWLNYDHLLKFEAKDEPFYHPDLDERIPVSEVLDGYGRPGAPDFEKQILKRLGGIEEGMNTVADTLQILQKMAKEKKALENHFAEVKELLSEAVQLPELRDAPELKNDFEKWEKNPSKTSITVVSYLLPTIVQKLIPMVPNIKIERELDRKDGTGLLSLAQKCVFGYKNRKSIEE